MILADPFAATAGAWAAAAWAAGAWADCTSTVEVVVAQPENRPTRAKAEIATHFLAFIGMPLSCYGCLER